ncbi:hypothetical protein INQ40_07380 [Lysobacter sp. H21R4]|nr:hypothetical protein [Lysobacter sp. H21R4]QOY61798.1 hypothetical protein INQ40_07380 [Lysobacter sp. H21R4]
MTTDSVQKILAASSVAECFASTGYSPDDHFPGVTKMVANVKRPDNEND